MWVVDGSVRITGLRLKMNTNSYFGMKGTHTGQWPQT